jgi:hypothetical protein
MRQYRNHIQLKEESVGNERRIEMLSDILQDGTFLPKTVEYKDIDETFKKWVEEKLYITAEGKEVPTMVLYSNQRFSEYTQSWEFTDANKNLILNFKTISRENNPQYGSIHNRLWNIPGERFYLMKRCKVLDDNGTESFLDLKMKQPMAIDLSYKVTIFCTKYQLINDFNTLVNGLFDARQEYIWPNNHPMPMTLDGIQDESNYQIDDRQFYGQSYNIKVMAYIITEEDYRVEQIPLKKKALTRNLKKAGVEIDEDTRELIIIFPSGCNKAKFTIDCDFETNSIETENIKQTKKTNLDTNQEVDILHATVFVNDKELVINDYGDNTVNQETFREYIFKNGDVFKIKIKKNDEKEVAMLKFLYKDAKK